jgi:hypothetical protein
VRAARVSTRIVHVVDYPISADSAQGRTVQGLGYMAGGDGQGPALDTHALPW